MIGIYKVTSPKGRIYIGQSNNIENRFKHYKAGHCKGQVRLVNSFNKYGINKHIFEVVELCSLKNLNERERFWQEHYKVLSIRGMNCVYVDINGKQSFSTKQTQKRKISALSKRKPLTKEHKIKISKSCKGRVVTKATKVKMSISSKGKKKSINHRKNISLSRKGMKLSEATKLKMKKPKSVEHILKMQISLGKRIQQLTLDGRLIANWFSASDAARSLGITHQGISLCCNNKKKDYKNYIWKFEN